MWIFALINLSLFFAFASFTAAQFIHNQLPIGSTFPVPGENATYDYVVVGAGTAGLTLATRLAQDGRYSVAVLEAGSWYALDNGNRSVIPGYDFYSANFTGLTGVNPLIDWEFMTTPQAELAGKRTHYPRGKCLAGCSARNYLVYQRPTVGTMKLWADRVGDKSWEWDHVLPFYKKSATFTPPDMSVRAANATPHYDASAFGDGPLHVSYARYASPYASWFADALTELGNPILTEGFQSGVLLGYDYCPSSLEPNMQERSDAQAYLTLALAQTQLNVYTHAFVQRVLFNADRVATGVEVETSGMKYTISASKEVIVSAGAFQSPQLLMVSGLGPKEMLEKYNIPVIKDLPGVGQNMEDTPLNAITYSINPHIETTASYAASPAKFAQAVADYNNHRTGHLTASGAEVISFENVRDMARFNLSAQAKQDLAWVPEDWPDTQFIAFGLWIGLGLGSTPPDAKSYGSIIASLTAPLSKGTVTIASSSMFDHPIIDPNWMTHPTDQELAIHALRRAREMGSTHAFTVGVGAQEAYPGTDKTSDADLLAVLREQTSTIAHAAVTCKMGRAGDPMAVVDSRARVFGVHQLRVVDISAFPFLPPGQPQASVYMFAEKIADDILRGGEEAGEYSE